MEDKTPEKSSELDSLEETGATVDDTKALEATPAPAPNPEPIKPVETTSSRINVGLRFRKFLKKFNIYLLIFLLIVVIGLVVVFISIQRGRKSNIVAPLTTQTLTADTLKQLQTGQTTVGDPKHILNVESNAIFAGTVLVRQSLDVAGDIKVGGNFNLSNIKASGTSTFDQLQASNITISGNAVIQKGLTVNGSGSFAGPLSAPALNINSLQLSGDLQLNRHLDAGGGTPSKSDGGALGGGGTSSVSGSDTAGTVTINTGSGPPAGCFVTVSFAQKFNATPHVVITPVGSAAGNLNYYINRTTTGFSICTANSPPAGSSFSFDYVALD